MGTNTVNKKVYLDDTGNPKKVYLDEGGNPVDSGLSQDVEGLRQRNLQRAGLPADYQPQPIQQSQSLGGALQSPFSQLAQQVLPDNRIAGSVGGTLDAIGFTPSNVIGGGLYNMVKPFVPYSDIPQQGLSPEVEALRQRNLQRTGANPDIPTRAMQFTHGAAETGLGALMTMNPAARGLVATNALLGSTSGAMPEIGQAVQQITNPATTITKGMSPFAQQLGQTLDIPLQALAYNLINKGMTPATEAQNIAKSTAEIRKVAPPPSPRTNAIAAKNYDQTIQNALGHINQKTQELGFPADVPAREQAINILESAKNDVFKQTKAPSDALPNVSVDFKTQALSDFEKGIKPEFKKNENARYEKMKAYIEDQFTNPDTMPEAFDHIQRLNQEIGSKIYGNNPQIQAQIQSDPDLTLAKKISLESMKNQYFQTLEENGYTGVKDLRGIEGALIKVKNNMLGNLEKNKKLDETTLWKAPWRDNPYSTAIAAEIGSHLLGLGGVGRVVAGAVTAGATMWHTMRNKPSPTIQRAFERLAKTGVQPKGIDFNPPQNPTGNEGGQGGTPSGTPIIPFKGGTPTASYPTYDELSSPVATTPAIERLAQPIRNNLYTKYNKNYIDGLSLEELQALAEKENMSNPADINEAPVSMGGNMNIRGKNNQLMIDKLRKMGYNR